MVSRRLYERFVKKEIDAVDVLHRKGVTESNKHSIPKLAGVLMSYGDFKDATGHFRILKEQVEQIQAVAYLLNQACSTEDTPMKTGERCHYERTRTPDVQFDELQDATESSYVSLLLARVTILTSLLNSLPHEIYPSIQSFQYDDAEGMGDIEISEIMLALRNQSHFNAQEAGVSEELQYNHKAAFQSGTDTVMTPLTLLAALRSTRPGNDTFSMHTPMP